jgi:hypothetical protein
MCSAPVSVNTHPGLPAKMRNNPSIRHMSIDQMLIDRHTIQEVWKVPPFQRHILLNKRFFTLVAEFRQTHCLPYGTLLIGCWNSILYVVDGNHRMAACIESGVPAIRANVQYVRFDTYVAMVAAYNKVQIPIKVSTPNDRLKVLADLHPPLQSIANACNFVTFSKAAAGQAGQLLTMSMLIQVWEWSKVNPPRPFGGASLEDLAKPLTQVDADNLIIFFQLCRFRFGLSPALWRAQNLALCLWLYRRLVLQENVDGEKWSNLTPAEFSVGLAGLVNGLYETCVTGKQLSSDADRNRIWAKLVQGFRLSMKQNLSRNSLKLHNIEGFRHRKGQ